jgi:hypothetical protein
MNPQLLQLFLPYLMQLFQGQSGQNGQHPFASLFGQNTLMGQTGGASGSPNALQSAQPGTPSAGSALAPANVVGGQVPVASPGQTSSFAVSPTGSPQSMEEIWRGLFSGMQNNSLTDQNNSAGNSFFGGQY